MIGNILLVIIMLAMVCVLVYGVIGMMRGANAEKQNKAMMLRVGLQGAALVLLAVLFAVGKD